MQHTFTHLAKEKSKLTQKFILMSLSFYDLIRNFYLHFYKNTILVVVKSLYIDTLH